MCDKSGNFGLQFINIQLMLCICNLNIMDEVQSIFVDWQSGISVAVLSSSCQLINNIPHDTLLLIEVVEILFHCLCLHCIT